MLKRIVTTRSALGRRGFTLIELMVTVAISGIILAAVLGFYVSVLHNSADQQARIQNQDSARLAMYEMSRYLRAACSSESNLTSLSDAFALAAPSECVFFCDVDSDGVAERVRFYVEGKTLRMQTAEPDLSKRPPVYPTGYQTNGIVILSGVQNGTQPIFRYYACDEETTSLYELTNTSSDDARRRIVVVGIRLVVNEEPRTARAPVELATRVQIRQRYSGGLDGS